MTEWIYWWYEGTLYRVRNADFSPGIGGLAVYGDDETIITIIRGSEVSLETVRAMRMFPC